MSTIDREKLLAWLSENAGPPGWNDTILAAELVAAIEAGELDVEDVRENKSDAELIAALRKRPYDRAAREAADRLEELTQAVARRNAGDHESGWICLLCKSGRPGIHGTLDDRVTPCPNAERDQPPR